MTKVLIQYKRSKNNSLKGVVVASPRGIGWSMCHPNDTFSKERAKEIALLRIDKWARLKGEGDLEAFNRWMDKIPHTMKPLVLEMNQRARKYFQ